MSREYLIGVYFPLIGYLKKNVSVTYDDLKARYMNASTKNTKEKDFQEWLNKLVADHIVSIEYDIVTFNEEQWDRILKINT